VFVIKALQGEALSNLFSGRGKCLLLLTWSSWKVGNPGGLQLLVGQLL